jgi:mono/diheme cytochrome c family protein
MNEKQAAETTQPASLIGKEFFVNLGWRVNNRRLKAAKFFILALGTVAVLTMTTCSQNAGNSRRDEQSSNQQNSQLVTRNRTPQANAASTPQIAETLGPPKAFQDNCAKCHGASGEGTKKYPQLKDVTTRAEDPLSEADLLATINDAKSLGLSAKMPSFKNKLTEEEKLEIIKWLKTLK